MRETAAPSVEPTVFIVEEDDVTRDLIARLVDATGCAAHAHGTPREFLENYRGDGPGCLVFSVHLPGMSGIDLYDQLRAQRRERPVIFLGERPVVPTVIRALRSRADDFHEKPIDRRRLLHSIQSAVRRDRGRHARRARWADIERRLARLTPKEREVLESLAAGKANKVIAARAGISERAVELRRSNLMKKLGAASLAELLELFLTHRLAAELDDSPEILPAYLDAR